MKNLERLKEVRNGIVLKLHKQKLDKGQLFLIRSSKLPKNQSYIEYPNHLVKIVIVSSDKRYIEIYSLQCGSEYEAALQVLKPEHNRLKVRKEKRNDLTEIEEIRLSELDGLLGVTQYLIDDTGRFHFSSQRTYSFQYGNEVISLIKNILLTEITDINNWMCAPIYGDAVVFYKSSREIVSVLNICLSCEAMAIDSSSQVVADCSTYEMLRKFFKDIDIPLES